MMHFWGGVLIALGVYTLTTFSQIKLKPSFKLIIISLLVITVTWEIFEWNTGLYDARNYLLDTIVDLVVGFSGGLLAHIFLRTYTMKII